jgi:hypothetical protein
MKQTKPAQAMELRSLSPVLGGRSGCGRIAPDADWRVLMAREHGFHCASCGRQTLHRQQSPNHVLHFLLGFLTCTLWWFVWLFLVIQDRPWLCTFCGSASSPAAPISGGPPPPARVTGLSPKTARILGGLLAVAVVGGIGLVAYLVLNEQALQRRVEEAARLRKRAFEKWRQEGRQTNPTSPAKARPPASHPETRHTTLFAQSEHAPRASRRS